MDGYAVRAADVAKASASNPIVLPVIETIAAGRQPSTPLPAGAAMRIMTGAPVPEGADSVIRVEDTDAGVERVAIRDARDAGRNLRPAAEDIRVGDIAVPAGTILGPSHIGVLASVGAAVAPVHARPRVAVMSSGDELVTVDNFEPVRRGERIVSSNSYSVRAAVAAAGGEVLDLGIVGDDPAALRETIARAKDCDLLVTTGGVSVGAYDFTKDVLRSMGATLDLWRVRMRPGAPIAFGQLGTTRWLGLPGNPVSALVTFELFGRPAIRRMLGDPRPFRKTLSVRLLERVTTNAPLTHFLRAVVEAEDGQLVARLTGPQGSGLLTSMARANALLVIPADRQEIAAGEIVSALVLNDSLARSEQFEF